MSNQIKAMLQLLKNCIEPDFHPDEDIFNEEILDKVYRISLRHDVAQVTANGILQSGHAQNDSDLWKQYKQQINMAVARTMHMEYEFDNICNVLDEHKVAYIPLKGAVIRELYPQHWMRTSCDSDILVSTKDIPVAREALEKVGYRTQKENYHDISMFSPSGIHLELHFKITESMMPMDNVLQRVWEFATPVSESSFRYKLSTEYQVFHATAHMAYHFYNGGCGIRMVLDMWILGRELQFDSAILNALLEEADLAKFYQGVQKLIKVWFEEDEPDDLSKSMEAYIVRGGVYGSMSNAISVRKTRKQSKTSFLISRIIPPYSMMKERNKILKKVPMLLPLCWILRLLTMLFFPKKRARAVRETKMSHAVSAEQIALHEEMLAGLGLAPESKS